jgi:hypothetical protein
MKWQLINTRTDLDNKLQTVTEVMQLPHGVVMKVTERPLFKNMCRPNGGVSTDAMSTAVAFIPHARVNEAGMIEHRM